MTKPKLLAAAAAAALVAIGQPHPARAQAAFQHVLLISVDGLHAVDLRRWTDDPAHAAGGLAWAVRHGVVYPRALAPAPSDSFPGMLALATGGSPKSTGVFYDDSYDRTLFAPGSDCAGTPGSEIPWTAAIDKDPTRPDAGGTIGQPLSQIDPAKLPRQRLSDGKCMPMLPHEFLRVNTAFEVLHRHGRRTAWADKHPAYEILNGPTGSGIDDLFTPEIDALIPPPEGDGRATHEASYAAARANDALRVRAVLNEIAGLDSTGARKVGVPALLGLAVQSVSVGQKLAQSGPADAPGLIGGYRDAAATPGDALAAQLADVDQAIAAMLDKLREQGLLERTLLIVTAKHGQSPIDPALRRAVAEAPYAKLPGHAFHVADDGALVWLLPQRRAADLDAARDALTAQADALAIRQLLTPSELAKLFRDPATDSRTPDFIAITQRGAIYTAGSKLAEHGGFAADDRNVALVVAASGIEPGTVTDVVQTTQVAPSILEALGYDSAELRAVILEGTQPLPGVNSADQGND